MIWEEKIEIIKKDFPNEDFNVPFTDWQGIFKKIESKFIKKENSNFRFSNWLENLKDKKLIAKSIVLTPYMRVKFKKLFFVG